MDVEIPPALLIPQRWRVAGIVPGHQSLHFDFSIIANDESMQTIKDKRKYK